MSWVRVPSSTPLSRRGVDSPRRCRASILSSRFRAISSIGRAADSKSVGCRFKSYMAHQLFPPLGCLREGRKPGMLPDTPLGDSNSTMPEEQSKKSPAPAFADDHPALDLAAAVLRVFGRYGQPTNKHTTKKHKTLRAV